MFLHSDYSQVRFHHRIWTKGLHHFGDYHEFNLEIEFVLAYIKLEITLILFKLVIHKVVYLYYCGIYTLCSI